MRRILTILVLLVAITLVPNDGLVAAARADGSGSMSSGVGDRLVGGACGEPGGQQGDPDRMGDDPTAQGKAGEPASGASQGDGTGQNDAAVQEYLLYLMSLLQLLGI